jgi:hypothetical protein
MSVSKAISLRRLETVRKRLASLSANALFVTPSSNLFYLTGIDFHRSERLTALFLFQDRDPFVICPAFEAERLRRMSAVDHVVTWEETEDPFAKAAALLPASSGILAVEPSTAYDDVERLLQSRTGWRPVSAASLFGALRMIKTPEELEMMRHAIAVALPRFQKAFAALRPGSLESEISTRFGGENVVQFGESSALPHGGSDRALQRTRRSDRRVDRPEGYCTTSRARRTTGRPPRIRSQVSRARRGRGGDRQRPHVRRPVLEVDAAALVIEGRDTARHFAPAQATASGSTCTSPVMVGRPRPSGTRGGRRAGIYRSGAQRALRAISSAGAPRRSGRARRASIRFSPRRLRASSRLALRTLRGATRPAPSRIRPDRGTAGAL